jgi:pyridoxal phosphate enzyme (YggS family)
MIEHRLAENLAYIRAKVALAARRGGRNVADVTLVAVLKQVDPQIARHLLSLQCTDLGESRPQDLWEKAEALGDKAVRWHLVGHLQTNKVQRTLPLVSLIHSADSMRLLHAINEAAGQLKKPGAVLIEVNVSGEPAKHGFAPQELEPYLAEIAGLPHVEVRGLMCMAGRAGDLNQARRDFARLRELRDRLRRLAPSNMNLTDLSMGMSGDFEAAIEEGATIVRIGSALFEGIDSSDA